LVCARLDTTPRCGVPCRCRRCRTVPWSSPRNVTLQMSRVAELGPLCRQRGVVRYESPENTGPRVTGHQGPRQSTSHLEQVSDAFSSCESHNFRPGWGRPGSQPRPVPVSGGVPQDGATDVCALRTGVGCFVLRWTIGVVAPAARNKRGGIPPSEHGRCPGLSMRVPNVALP
jgi:hypothetical protein